MLIVSDTTPIISLMKADNLNLLNKLFGQVIIPNAVYDELISNNKFSYEVECIKSCEFIKVKSVENTKAVEVLKSSAGLDEGECQAIVLADENNADLLLMDEHKGREVAKKMGLRITGTIGILLQAFDEKIINSEEVDRCMRRMFEYNIRISEVLRNKVYRHIEPCIRN